MRAHVAVIALSYPCYAQAADSTTAAVRILVDYVAENGKVAMMDRGRVTKLTSEFLPLADCRVLLRQVGDISGSVFATETEVALSSLSPAIEVKAWSNKAAFGVKATTTTGANELVMRTTRGAGPNGKTRLIDLVVEDSALADGLARHLATAIRRCGGHEATAEIRARTKESEAREKASTDSLLGHDLSPEDRAAIVKACREVVREKLRAPTTAIFDDGNAEPSVFAVTDGQPTLLGKVEAQNALGGRVTQSYMCTMEKFGRRYVPKLATLLN